MREGLLNEIREMLEIEEGCFEYIGKDEEECVVAVADGIDVIVLKFDEEWEEAEVISQYPLSMRRNDMWEAV